MIYFMENIYRIRFCVVNQLSELKKQCSEKNKEILALRNEINDLKKENRRYRDMINQIHSVSRLEDK